MNTAKHLQSEIARDAADLASASGMSPEAAKDLAETLIADAHDLLAAPSPEQKRYLDKLARWYASPPVCATDEASQVSWLKQNADEALLHQIATRVSPDAQPKLADCVLSDPRTSRSAACYQVIMFVIGGAVGGGSPQEPMMKRTAARIREGFYKGASGLEARAIGPRDRDLYANALARYGKGEEWHLPDTAFGPFPESTNHKSRFDFEDGIIRLSYEEWEKTNK